MNTRRRDEYLNTEPAQLKTSENRVFIFVVRNRRRRSEGGYKPIHFSHRTLVENLKKIRGVDA